MTINDNVKTRVKTELKPVNYNDQFNLPLEKRTYKQQYANIYFMRLELQRKDLIRAAETKWGSTTIEGTPVKHARKVLETEPDVALWVVGTVYKEMKYKPNILEDITASHYGAPPVKQEKYIGGGNDEILLEDESGRLKLVGDFISRQLLVTGVVVAVLGAENSKGEFDVIDMVFSGLAPQLGRFHSSDHEKKYVALVSGLSLGRGDIDAGKYSWTVLQEYLTGELGDSEDEELVSQISRLIIAGNSVVPDSEVEAKKLKIKQEKIPLAFSFEHPPLHEWPIDQFDSILAELAQSVPISVMPGDDDPATSEFPQQPLQSALFTRSNIFIGSGLELHTNPYWWDIDGVRILGSSGQPIDDIYKYVNGNDRISMMEACLRWRHMAPTAPDTLWTYPFLETDPFVLNETPHVYFCGNQPYYDTKYIKEEDGTEMRIISLPKFSETGEFVLLELNSLECSLVTCG